VLVVPGIGADAEDPRFARLAACGKGGGIEPVVQERGRFGLGFLRRATRVGFVRAFSIIIRRGPAIRPHRMDSARLR
jgi:hypothetical protein